MIPGATTQEWARECVAELTDEKLARFLLQNAAILGVGDVVALIEAIRRDEYLDQIGASERYV